MGEPLDPQYAKELADLQETLRRALQEQINNILRGKK